MCKKNQYVYKESMLQISGSLNIGLNKLGLKKVGKIKKKKKKNLLLKICTCQYRAFYEKPTEGTQSLVNFDYFITQTYIIIQQLTLCHHPCLIYILKHEL